MEGGSSILFSFVCFLTSIPFATPTLGPKIRTCMASARLASAVFPSKSSIKFGGANPHPSLPFSSVVLKFVDLILRTYPGWEEGVGEVKSYN